MEKAPNAKLPFGVDWSVWLAKEDDAISEVEWIVPEGLVKSNNPPPSVTDEGMAIVWLTGGTPRKPYSVTCRIITEGGRVEERTLQITVNRR